MIVRNKNLWPELQNHSVEDVFSLEAHEYSNEVRKINWHDTNIDDLYNPDDLAMIMICYCPYLDKIKR